MHPNHFLPSPTPTSCACEERFVEEPLSKAIDACSIRCLCFSLVLNPDPPPSLGAAHAGKLAAAVGLDGGEQGAGEVDHKGRHGLHLRPLAGGLLVASASRSISDWHKLQVLGEVSTPLSFLPLPVECVCVMYSKQSCCCENYKHSLKAQS
uniref:Uncharacterized protein n=1 Tax=Triticum urartu TaxID=4572 RepID=A0A8R7TT47_TRIUA